MTFRKRDKISPLQDSIKSSSIDEKGHEKFSIFNQTGNKQDGNVCCCCFPGCWCRQAIFDLCFNPITDLIRIYVTVLCTVFFVICSQTEAMDFTLINYLCLLFFTIDVFLKIFALGFVMGRNTFLGSDLWNIFDFCIVIMGWPFIYFVWLSPFRVFILFRLLTKLPFLTTLQQILHSFWAVIPKLKGLIILIISIYFIFVISGVDLFKGDIGRRCVYVEDDTLLRASNATIMTMDEYVENGIIFEEMLPPTWCSHSGDFGVSCEKKDNFYCMDGNTGYYDNVGTFDTWPQSLLVSFQLISLSGWSQYYVSLRGVEGWLLPLVWMILLIFWIVFVVFNIVISAVENAFGLKNEHKEFTESRTKKMSNQTIVTRIFSGLFDSSIDRVFYCLERRFYCFRSLCGCRNCCVTFVTSSFFDLFITLLITINILLEFLIDDNEVISTISIVFTCIYLLESLMKICVIGPEYFKSFYNLMDVVLVFTSIALFVVTRLGNLSTNLESTIYVIRLVRTISILSRFPITRGFMRKVTYSVFPAAVLLFFCACVLFMFATLGHMIYNNLSRQTPRGFDTIADSILTLFVILTGDNWEDMMYDPLSRKPKEEQKLYEDHPHLNEPKTWFAVVLSGPFFIVFFIVTNLFLLNFFTAVVLYSYSAAADDSNYWENFKGCVKDSMKSIWRTITCSRLFRSNTIDQAKYGAEEKKSSRGWLDKIRFIRWCCDCLRYFPRKIRSSRIYYIIMLCFSLLAVVVMIFDDLPSLDRSKGYKIEFWMFVVDCVLWGVFAIDVMLGGLTEGVGYLMSLYSLLDIVFLWELTITIFFTILLNNNIPWTIVYIRMAIRCIRPLKVVFQFPDLKIYLNSVKNMVGAFFQLVLLLVIVLVIYGVIGNKLFKNKFLDCNDSSKFSIENYDVDDYKETEARCQGYFFYPTNGLLIPRAFYHFDSNFDDVGRSLLTLTEISSLDGWSEQMYYVYKQKADPYSSLYSIYFISFVVIVVLFVITISIGIVLGGIMAERNLDETSTPQQIHWSYMIRYIYISNPKPKIVPLLGKYLCCFPLHWSFQILVLIVIVADYFVISLQWFGQDYNQEFIVNTLSFICVFLFCFEDILKLAATGFAYFFSDMWNLLDFAIVLFSPFVLGLLLYYQITNAIRTGVVEFSYMRLYLKGVTRLVLFLRLFQFATSFPSVRRIFRTLVLAIPSVINACILLGCIIFGYALLGRLIFGTVRFGHFYNFHVNFREWDKAICLLLKMLTFDNWRGIMHDLAVSEPHCTNHETFNDCGSPALSYIYFISYGVLISTLVLNLFIGIILDNFSIEFLESGFPITREVVDSFKKIWAKYDVNAIGLIKLKKVKNLILDLSRKDHILGFDARKGNSRGYRMYWIVYHELQLKDYSVYQCDTEKKATKYLFRFNIFLSVYNFLMRVKRFWISCLRCCGLLDFQKFERKKDREFENEKWYWALKRKLFTLIRCCGLLDFDFEEKREKNCCRKWCMNCYSCCGLFASKEKGGLVIQDSRKVTFNKVLIALCRLALDNNVGKSSAGQTIEERQLRRKFLKDALNSISDKKFTRSDTEILKRKLKVLRRKKKKVFEKLIDLAKKKVDEQSLRRMTLVSEAAKFVINESGMPDETLQQQNEEEKELEDIPRQSTEENGSNFKEDEGEEEEDVKQNESDDSAGSFTIAQIPGELGNHRYMDKLKIPENDTSLSDIDGTTPPPSPYFYSDRPEDTEDSDQDTSLIDDDGI